MSLSNELPPWWSSQLDDMIVDMAVRYDPNEVCGIFYTVANHENQVLLQCFDGPRSPMMCLGDSSQVVSFVYNVERLQGRYLGTFHTHPTGELMFSDTDLMLANWGSWHVLLAKRNVANTSFVWEKVVAVRGENWAL